MSLYNPRPFNWLKEAVDSILNQTFEDFEFLIYDDGSEGECRKEVAELEKRDARIRVLRGEENRGIAYGLNQCIRQARGKYLARMDGDDISLPRRLELQAAFLDTYPEYDYTGSGAALLEQGKLWGIRQMPELPRKEDFLSFSPYIHPSVMFRREVFEKYGLYDTSDLCRRCEDYELFIRLHIAGSQGYNLKEILLHYREEKSSYKKRSFQSRRREARLRRQTFPALGLLGFRAQCCKYKPYGAALLPLTLYRQIKRYRDTM